MATINTHSILGKLRANVGRAEGNLKRCQTRYDDLRARWSAAPEAQRPSLQSRGRLAKLELDDAAAYLAEMRRLLAAEEKRLMQPDAFLHFG
jgi:phage shock protein A